MGQRLVVTPNGKYAAFSDIVDHFIAYDMTKDEALKFCVDEWGLGPNGSESKVTSADYDKTWDGGEGRYEEAISTIRQVHVDAEAIKWENILEV